MTGLRSLMAPQMSVHILVMLPQCTQHSYGTKSTWDTVRSDCKLMNNDYLNDNVTRRPIADRCKTDNVQMRKTGNVQGRTTEMMHHVQRNSALQDTNQQSLLSDSNSATHHSPSCREKTWRSMSVVCPFPIPP